MNTEKETPIPPRQFWKTVLLSTLSSSFFGLILVALPYLLVAFFDQKSDRDHGTLFIGYSYTLLFLLPFAQGAFAEWRIRETAFNAFGRFIVCFFIVCIDLFLSYFIMKEGIICLIIAFPYYIVTPFLGMVMVSAIGKHRDNKKIKVTFAPLLLLAVALDVNAPPPELSNAISDTVTIQAPPEVVWRYIVEYPVNEKEPEYWLWKIGLPAPTHSVAEGESVGDSRECRFTDGIVFKERITEAVPGKVLTFDITEQPDHPEIIGHFSLDKGQLYLEANPDGSTTVIATSWYRIFVRPAAYFDWWAEDIVREVHFRVLNHMKALAERSQKGVI